MIAHIGGLPVEETVGSIGPAILVAFGAAFRATCHGLLCCAVLRKLAAMRVDQDVRIDRDHPPRPS